MPAKTLPPAGTTITAALGAPQPAGAVKRAANPAPATKASNTANFQAWKEAISTAREAVSYSDKSPIYGKTDIEVISAMRTELEDIRARAVADGSVKPASNLNAALTNAVATMEELLKRKVAKQVAGQSYKQSHKS